MRIGETAERTGISEYTLRYYEKKGLIRVGRDEAGRRDYREEDLEWFRFIQRLKDTGMLLRDIRTYSELRYEGRATMKERMQMLKVHRDYVIRQREKWENHFRNLEDKIAFYEKEITNDSENET
ncbi:MerR family transcriptional regulator [Anaerostipes sp.]|uniref:MerR family transcriptional regulator n=1 Tax=Anaerostipes sp. TaxID=1872530 RepID=UPI0025B8A5FD|nr:MerR family transcriptional regulator [Anaerostipes sp.]MBS7009679.1 MerR family transcriptional regulator [Anaerostipes sp.]